MSNEYLVEVSHLKQYFPIRSGFKTINLKAVDDVSFNIRPGETLGLVGESGCGKTTAGRTLLRLYNPTSGSVKFDGEEVTDKNIYRLRKEMQMVFQDPYSSLNPRMTVEDIIGEPLDVHKLYQSKGERHDKVIQLMETVGLNAEQWNLFNSTNSTNQVLSDYSAIFKTCTDGTYSDSETFELTTTAASTYKGTDGRQIGVYGGMMPFNPQPSNPQITNCTVAEKSDANGMLSIDITVQGAQ